MLSCEARVLQDKREVIKHMEGFVHEYLPILRPVDQVWQPSGFLPQMGEATWHEEVRALQHRAKNLSDPLLLVLIGNMITEEALPSYLTWFNSLEGIGHQEGTSHNPWAVWGRSWTAEESRHGSLINTYLYLTGRVNMGAIERTIQYLIKNGFDPLTDQDPYLGLVYTSFQERATNIAHRNTGRMAIKQGEELLGQMCNMIAGDEARHENAYKLFFRRVMELDPNGAVLSFAEMMKRKIVMPAKHMAHGAEKDLFIQHIVMAQRLGIYTAEDYSQIISHLVEYWGIPTLTSLNAEALEAQDYLSGLSEFYRKKASHLALVARMRPKMKCPWLFGRLV